MLYKIHTATLYVCAFMAISTGYMASQGTTPWFFPVGFLVLYLQPVWFYYAQQGWEYFKKRKQTRGR